MADSGSAPPSPADVKIFLISTVAISIAMWDIAFNLGAFKTIFFDKIFMVWVASTSALLASVFVPRPEGGRRFLSWRGRFVLLLPTVWVSLQLSVLGTLVGSSVETMTIAFGVLCTLITLPYTIYILVLIVTPDLENLRSPRLFVAMVVTVSVISATGFAVGRNNDLFLTCEDFTVSGNDTPPNCARLTVGSERNT